MPDETTFRGELLYQAAMGSWRGQGLVRVLPGSPEMAWSIQGGLLRKGITANTHYLKILGVDRSGSVVRITLDDDWADESLSIKTPHAEQLFDSLQEWCRRHHGGDGTGEEDEPQRDDPAAAPLNDAEVAALEAGMGKLQRWWPDPNDVDEADEEPRRSDCLLSLDNDCHPAWAVYWFSAPRLGGTAFCGRCLRRYLEQGTWPWSDWAEGCGPDH